MERKKRGGKKNNENVHEVKSDYLYPSDCCCSLLSGTFYLYVFFTAFKTEAEAIAYPPRLFPSKWLFETLKTHGNHSPLVHT